jgi:cardiolipin synthase (CMP-forming)
MRNLPNILTISRLAALPVLWVFALAGANRWLAVGIAVAASTDAIDGFVARARDLRTDLGSRLDSIADHLLSGSVLIWLIWLQPAFASRYAAWLIGWGALGIVTLGVGWIRFRRIGDLHLLSAKLAMVLAYLFVVSLFYFGSYEPLLFGLVIGTCFVATGESLLVYLTRREPSERIGSILLRRHRHRHPHRRGSPRGVGRE